MALIGNNNTDEFVIINEEEEEEDDGEEEDEEEEFEDESDDPNVDYDLENLSDGEHPERGRNWRIRALFNGRITDCDLPPDCVRPQSSHRRTFPASTSSPLCFHYNNASTSHNSVVYAANSAPMKQTHSADNTIMMRALANAERTAQIVNTIPSTAAMSVNDSSSSNSSAEKKKPDDNAQGYVLANGRTWVRKKPKNYITPICRPSEVSDTITATATTVAMSSNAVAKANGRRCFLGNSLRIINGKRIYSSSRECYQHAQNGSCPAGCFCAYEHNASATHQQQKFCYRLLRGTCRNNADCPDGEHASLQRHQYPVCEYFIRMMCAKRADCPYLHVKHTDGLVPCQLFNRGICMQGAMCDKPHRYYQNIMKKRAFIPTNVSLSPNQRPLNNATSGSVESNGGGLPQADDDDNSTLKWYT